jgi:serine/threonine-protein kinase
MTPPPNPEPSLIGAIIADRYRIIAHVGEGGMGQVYLAEHVLMKRRSAIKVMRPALVGDAEALQRFTREAENASKLSHPNVASIFDFGETPDGIVYLAMEFIDGESLHAKLARDVAMHPEVAADVIGQAADALQAAHDLGILHRDLKPDNLMLSTRPDGTYLVKLVDFGIARTTDSGATRVTRTGMVIGTPEYMSPEQLSSEPLDARSDQYALALVAFVALTGREAFGETTGKDSFILRLTSRPRRLAEVRPDIDWPITLQSVFDRALAPEANDRYEHISHFADSLASAIGTIPQTETAEIYRRALEGRAIGAARRTPGFNEQTTASKLGKQPVDNKSDRKTPRLAAATSVGVSGADLRAPEPARAIGMPGSGRRSIWPTFLFIGVAIYALYWYGAQQPSGSARDVSDVIATVSRTVASPVMPYLNRIRASATVPSPSDSATTTGIAPLTPTAERKRAAKAASAAERAAANSATRTSLDSTPRDSVPRDTAAPKKLSTDTTKPPG